MLSYLFSSTIFCQILKTMLLTATTMLFLTLPFNFAHTIWSPSGIRRFRTRSDRSYLKDRERRICHLFVIGHNLFNKNSLHSCLCFLLPYHAVDMYSPIYPVYHFWNYLFLSNISENYFIRHISWFLPWWISFSFLPVFSFPSFFRTFLYLLYYSGDLTTFIFLITSSR